MYFYKDTVFLQHSSSTTALRYISPLICPFLVLSGYQIVIFLQAKWLSYAVNLVTIDFVI